MVAGAAADVAARARAYDLKLHDGAFFSHGTAAVLHGFWLPRRVQEDPLLDVGVFPPIRAPRDRGVRGRSLTFHAQRVVSTRGLPVLGATETWCRLAEVLDHDELVVAGDGLVQHGVPDPPAVLAELRELTAAPQRRRRSRLLAALVDVRPGARSPQETLLRLLLVHSGLPEPTMNHRIVAPDGQFLAEGDLVHLRERLVLEFEGDVHRTDVRVWRKDIVRRERLNDFGWWTIRLTADDVHVRPDETVARVRRELARRRPDAELSATSGRQMAG